MYSEFESGRQRTSKMRPCRAPAARSAAARRSARSASCCRFCAATRSFARCFSARSSCLTRSSCSCCSLNADGAFFRSLFSCFTTFFASAASFRLALRLASSSAALARVASSARSAASSAALRATSAVWPACVGRSAAAPSQLQRVHGFTCTKRAEFSQALGSEKPADSDRRI